MEMSRGEWPYRRLGQVLGKCSTKVLVNRLIQLMFTNALSRRAQILLFPNGLLHHVYLLPLLYINKHAPLLKGRESYSEIPASHYYQGADLQAFHEFHRELLFENLFPLYTFSAAIHTNIW